MGAAETTTAPAIPERWRRFDLKERLDRICRPGGQAASAALQTALFEADAASDDGEVPAESGGEAAEREPSA